MFKVIEEQKESVTVKMDISTFQGLQDEIDEDISKYEFVFEDPTPASELLTK